MPQPRQVCIIAVLVRVSGKQPEDGIQILELQAFLTPDGRMDIANHRTEQPARRMRGEQEIWAGWLLGIERGWALRSATGEDAPLWHLTADQLRPGEHLTLRAPEGDDLVFRVVNVTAAGG